MWRGRPARGATPGYNSVRYRPPRSTANCFAEVFDRQMDVPTRLRICQPVQVEVAPSDGCEVERPKETHQRVNKERATSRPRVAMIVAEMSFDRRHDASVDDARLQRSRHICGVDGVKVQPNFGHLF